MNTEQERLKILFEKYFSKTASAEERSELAALIQNAKLRDEAMNLITGSWEKYETEEELIPAGKSDEILHHILGAGGAKVMHLQRKQNDFWKKVAVAASIILLLGSGAWFIFFNRQQKPETAKVNMPAPTDIQSGTNGAILTLDNGQQIILDSLPNGLIAQQGNSNIVKQGEELSYRFYGAATAVSYNTIATPKGRQYLNLILADGSKVSLDAGSSIRFPVSFAGERKVEITGQVWFDIAHNDKMPFKVMANGVEIIDLGTEFNVNAYSDEDKIKVTLLKGKISIQSKTLKPGQQAILRQAEDDKLYNMQIADNANLDEVMAWKNGRFSFRNADIKSVMRQLSRWYDIEVIYQGKVPDQHFNGEIGRGLTLKEMLEGLAFTSDHFQIEEGKKLIIK